MLKLPVLVLLLILAAAPGFSQGQPVPEWAETETLSGAAPQPPEGEAAKGGSAGVPAGVWIAIGAIVVVAAFLVISSAFKALPPDTAPQ